MKEEQPHSSFPLSFRPDHCKFLVDTGVSKFGEVFLIWPNNSVPGVEKKPEMKSMISLLKKAAPQNTIILCHKTVRKIIYLSPSGKAVLADLGVDVP
jgi:hypothetical protein